jgi:hypothetical protein
VRMGDVKKRVVPYVGPIGYWRQEYRGLGAPHNTQGPAALSADWLPFQGTQVTESENHTQWSERFKYWKLEHMPSQGGYVSNPYAEKQATATDLGGDFTSEKKWVMGPDVPAPQTLTSGWYNPGGVPYEERDTIVCAVLPLDTHFMPFPPSARSSETDLQAYGTTAIARCSPTNNVANLAVALTELYHEGLPNLLGASLWESRVRKLRDVKAASGDEYLNVQFGYKPLVGDILDTVKGVVKLSHRISQAERDSGKVVRRQYSFPPVVQVSETTINDRTGVTLMSRTGFSSLEQPPYNQGKVVRHRVTTINRWFSGAFTYYLPPRGIGMLDKLDQARKILGLDLNLDVIWNLTPWSWAVDWFSNTGDYLSNIDSWIQYGLVVRYGYIMEHSSVQDTYYFTGPTGLKSGNVFPQSVTLVTETKLRRRATPFGFGFTGVLNNTQKTIVAALGLNRGR